MISLFFIFAILALAVILAIYNYDFHKGSCGKCFSKELRKVATLSDDIRVLFDSPVCFEWERAVALLGENRNRLYDLTTGLIKECRHNGLVLTSREWRRLYDCVYSYLEQNNGSFSLETMEATVADFAQQHADFTLYELYALPLVLKLAILYKLHHNVATLIKKMHKQNRIKRIAKSGSKAAVLDELFADQEQVYNLLMLTEYRGEYKDAVAKASMSYGISLESLQSGFTAENIGINLSTENLFNSLMTLKLDIDELSILFEQEKVLLAQQDGYALSDKGTKRHYRQELYNFCRASGQAELQTVLKLVLLCSEKTDLHAQMGYYLLMDGQAEFAKKLECKRKTKREQKGINGWLYYAIFALLTVFFVYLFSLPIRFAAEWIRVILVVLFLAPAVYFAKCLSDNILSTLVKPVPLAKMQVEVAESPENKTVLVVPCLTGSLEKCERMLKKLELCWLSNGPAHCYVLLCDLPPAKQPDQDKEQLLFSYLREGIQLLNEKYGGCFACFVRQNKQQPNGEFAPDERKRGALLSLCRFIQDGENEFAYYYGEQSIKGAHYVFTIDEDTVLAPGTVSTLKSVIAHPLNVRQQGAGYGIVQPALLSGIPYSQKSAFSQLFLTGKMLSSYPGGADLYARLAQGSPFGGKGIFCVSEYLSTQENMPKGCILSHDQPEGDLMGCATYAGIEAAEAVPQNPIDYFKREHRWVRGDWQNLLLLLGKKTFSSVFRMNTMLNCLFSTREIAITLILLLCGALLPQAFVAVLAMLIGFMAIPVILSVLRRLLCLLQLTQGVCDFSDACKEIGARILHLAMYLLLLPCKAAVISDGIMKAIYRSYVSRKNLMQWSENGQSGLDTAHYFATMWAAPFFGLLLLVFSIVTKYNIPLCAILCALYGFVPLLFYNVSQPIVKRKYFLSGSEKQTLTVLAARTLCFFAEGMSKAHNYLPPDNYQAEPYQGFCDRTSITNIGFGILSVVCGCNMGILSQNYAVELLEKTMQTLEALPTAEGCHYNWYSVSTLENLGGFLSAVDCGNLCACLCTAGQMLKQMRTRDLMDDETPMKIAALLCSEQSIRTGRDTRALCEALEQSSGKGCAAWLAQDRSDVEDMLSGFDSRAALGLFQSWKACAQNLETPGYAQDIHARMETLGEKLIKMARAENLEFLYNKEKNVFHIGYDCANGKHTASCYDLFASENLLCSYYAISLGKVPPAHWFALSRKTVRINARAALLSWSGTMFEYLMPLLFFRTDPNSLLGISGQEVMRRNIETGEALRTPFGISESCYADLSAHGDYRYSAFGMSDLALDTKHAKPVFAPYASILGIEQYPKEVYKNISDMTALGMADVFGLYESLDYRYDPPRPVKCYMSHHQGMILCALCNFLNFSAVRNAFMATPEMDACKLVLYEEVPENMPNYKNKQKDYHLSDQSLPFCKVNAARLANGDAVFCMHPNGFSLSFDRVVVVPNNVLPYGRSGRVYVTQGGRYCPVHFSKIEAGLSRMVCTAEYPDFILQMEVVPLPDGKSFAMSFTVKNKSKQEKEISIALGADLYLARKQQYEAHPQYNNIFVCAEMQEDYALAYTKRNNGSVSYAAGLAVVDRDAVYYTSRRSFYGRNNLYTADPAASPENNKVPLEPMLGCQTTLVIQSQKSKGFCAVIECGFSKESVRDGLSKTVQDMSLPEYKRIAVEQAKRFIHINRMTESEQRLFMELSGALILGGQCTKTLPLTLDIFYRLGMPGTNRSVLMQLESDDAGFAREVCKVLSLLAQDGAIDIIFAPEPGILSDAEALCAGYNHIGCGRAAVIALDHAESYGQAVDLVIHNDGHVSLRRLLPVTQSKSGYFSASDLSYMPTGFCTDGYAVLLQDCTPRPWCNVLSNGVIGCVQTESGGGNTFGDNANMCKYTRAPGDWVTDVPSEIVYLSDAHAKQTWSITAAPIHRGDDHLVFHGFGFTDYYYNGFDIEAIQTVFVDKEQPRKYYVISLHNTGKEARNLTVGIYLDAFIGERYSEKKLCRYEVREDGAYCDNGAGYSLCLSGAQQYGVCSESFIGPSMDLCAPKLNTEPAGRPDCLCGTTMVQLAPGEKKVIFFSFGQQGAVQRPVEHLLSDVKAYYADFLDHIAFETGNKTLDAFLGKWMPYQTLNSRMLARCGFYQAGGAVGFRDQLQDCLCMMYFNKPMVREHILMCAEHQYTEGDVQHWWHTATLGVRTKMTDDRLWLVYVACEYAAYSGDYGIFDEQRHFLQGQPLTSSAFYGEAQISPESATLYEHCRRAMQISMTAGSHGLPLIGGGDWNDAMDEVGIHGQGESVWLGWFFLSVADRFEKITQRYNDTAFAAQIIEYSKALLAALEQNGWERDRYLRAFTDDGQALGSRESRACKIDAISQAWAVLSGFADGDRQHVAIKTAYKLLLDKNNKVVRLLTPPFSYKTEKAGYINDYPEGIRENGGQYTHGVLWLAKALAKLGYGDEAWDILQTVSPLMRSSSELQHYGNEPYVLSADIYTDGRGGWSWYTGAAGWYYTIFLNDIYGIKIRGTRMDIDPCFPSSWNKARLVLNMQDTRYIMEYHNPLAKSGSKPRVLVDGKPTDGGFDIVADGGEHRVSVIL